MTDEGPGKAVASYEILARFILFNRWIRNDGTVKPDAFIPHPYPDLSVTRLKYLPEQEVWRIGQSIAGARPATLYGRADIPAAEARRRTLDVEPRPVADNPNHAVVVGWPDDRPAQKIIAQELAVEARFVPRPPPASG
ncbi:MAG: hypothetical protein HY010_16660 [Acidobacteria bacterium]|nr:hypothetical protein [Acidobacteriota bacterium]